jgi:hypothetical protein
MSVTQSSLSKLHEISRRWAARNTPENLPEDIPIRQLPRTRYEGNNSYNGFSAEERKRTEQVMQVLRRRGFLSTKAGCSLCGSKVRTQFHSEDYFDPFAATPICGPCHMTLHQRFKQPKRWLERLDRFSDSPFIAEFRALPMEPVDFAAWLRENTDAPRDPVRAVWPNRDVPDYRPRERTLSPAARRIADALIAVKPTDTEWRLLEVLHRNPDSTAEHLTGQMGWKGNSAWHLRFGLFCRRLERDLGPAPTTDERRDGDDDPAKFYIGLIATFDDRTRGFTLRPDADAAVTVLVAQRGFAWTAMKTSDGGPG